MDFLQHFQLQSSHSGNATGSNWITSTGNPIESYSPVDGALIGTVTEADEQVYDQIIQKAQNAFLEWRNWPAPKRGEIVRQVGEALRKEKDQLDRALAS